MPRNRAKNNDPGVSPPGGRTVPEWMDPKGEHGELTVLLMEPLYRDHKLPSNPFIVARSIKEQAGSIAAAYRDRDGNLVIKVRSAKKAAKLKEMTKLIDGSEIKISEHARLNQVRCIVTCHSVADLSDEELTEEMADQGVIEIRRIGKSNARSATMVVTLRGTVVPTELYFGYDLCRTREYKQAPMQCYRCYEYGHTKARCPAKSEELCRNCSQPHPIQKDDQGKTICTAPAHCRNCNGGHSPTSRTCPKYREEEIINEIRTKEDKSPREARRLFEERKATAGSSYANVANNEKSHAATQKELEATKRALKEALDELIKIKSSLQAIPAKQTPKITKTPKTSVKQVPTVPESQDNDSDNNETETDMECDDNDSRKRKISSFSSNEDTNSEGSEDSEDSQKLAPLFRKKNDPASAKGGTSQTKNAEPTPTVKTPKLKNVPKKSKKNGSGQNDSSTTEPTNKK